MSATTFDRVRDIICEKTGIDPETVLPASKLEEDLQLDSFDVVDMAVRIEEEFEVECPNQELGDLRTVDDAVKLIDKKLAEK